MLHQFVQLAAIVWFAGTTAAAQVESPTSTVPPTVPPTGTTAPASAADAQPPAHAPAATPMAPPGPLLREGSYVLQVKGTLHRDAQRGWWFFRVATDEPEKRGYELTLLPCTLLANLEQLVTSMPQREIVFDLTGQVFVYRGRNYLLPTHAPHLVEYVAPTPGDGGDAATEDTPDEGESAQAILRGLERAVGPVPRTPRAGPQSTGGQGSRPDDLLPSGTIILWRRGWMARGDAGAWSFVFEADASGLADPPMILLPSLLLEDMERHAQRSGPETPLLVSGRVYRYHGRNYLLPTMFQVPRDHSALRP